MLSRQSAAEETPAQRIPPASVPAIRDAARAGRRRHMPPVSTSRFVLLHPIAAPARSQDESKLRPQRQGEMEMIAVTTGSNRRRIGATLSGIAVLVRIAMVIA